MKIIETTLLLIAVFIIAGCNDEKEKTKAFPLRYFNDMEQLWGWVDVPTLAKANAHSGSYVSKMDTINPYSITFRRKLNEISDGHIKRAEVNGWIYFNAPEPKGFIVCDVNSTPGVSLIFLTSPIEFDESKINTWQKVSGEFYLPENLDPNYTLGLYFCNSTKSEMLLDDMEIKYTDY